MQPTNQAQPRTSRTRAATDTSATSSNTAGNQTSAVTVLLTNEQAALLDGAAANIRRNTGVAISRSAMLRAILSAVLPFRQEWSRCQSAMDVEQKITNRLRADELYATIQQRAAAVQRG